jgi:hypothetical protein
VKIYDQNLHGGPPGHGHSDPALGADAMASRCQCPDAAGDAHLTLLSAICQAFERSATRRSLANYPDLPKSIRPKEVVRLDSCSWKGEVDLPYS